MTEEEILIHKIKSLQDEIICMGDHPEDLKKAWGLAFELRKKYKELEEYRTSNDPQI